MNYYSYLQLKRTCIFLCYTQPPRYTDWMHMKQSKFFNRLYYALLDGLPISSLSLNSKYLIKMKAYAVNSLQAS